MRITEHRFTERVSPHRYLPALAIWYWTTIQTKSSVTLVNDKYRYDVFNIVTGELLFQNSKDTLAEAKQEVFALTNI
jgi:hypothetical protein